MDPATRMLVNSVGVAALTTILSFMAAWFWWKKNEATKESERIARGHSELMGRVNDLERQLASVSQAVVPISTAFQAILIKELTHFHTPVMDALMVKVGPPNILTEEEEIQLAHALEERTRDMGTEISDSERDAAVMLPMVMKRAKIEAEELANAPVELKVVAVKPETEGSSLAPAEPGPESPKL